MFGFILSKANILGHTTTVVFLHYPQLYWWIQGRGMPRHIFLSFHRIVLLSTGSVFIKPMLQIHLSFVLVF